MIIKICCNGLKELLTLDTTTGAVSGIPDNSQRNDIGYLHLDPEAHYTAEEQAEINRILILAWADKWAPWSLTPMITLDSVSLPLDIPKRLADIAGILGAAIDPDVSPIEACFGWGPLRYPSEDARRDALYQIMRQSFITKLMPVPTHYLSFGASFQRFAPSDWLAQAEAIKGGKIYLA